MAKTVCEDHANLLLNERVTISAGSSSEWLDEILSANNFYLRGNNLVELTFALGTGAFVEYLGSDGQPMIDYIRGDIIYPLAWDNGRITECAFGSVKKHRDSRVYYIQLHRLENSRYIIENIMLDHDSGKPVELPEGVMPIMHTGSTEPLFQIIKPNIINNADLDSPMGISIFGNALDQLKGCDLIYDSYMNEFRLGRKRIMVPMSMARIQMSKDGTMQPLFDPNDTEFYAFETSADGTQELREINMEIRAEQHETAMDRVLDLLSKKCGLGNGRYKFDGSGIKTATEVISEKSELYQNLRKNEIILRSALEGMVRALAYLCGKAVDEICIGFDDSIIEDSQAVMNDNIALVGAGLKSKLTAIMEIQHLDEAAAKAELDRIDRENGVLETEYEGAADGYLG